MRKGDNRMKTALGKAKNRFPCENVVRNAENAFTNLKCFTQRLKRIYRVKISLAKAKANLGSANAVRNAESAFTEGKRV